MYGKIGRYAVSSILALTLFGSASPGAQGQARIPDEFTNLQVLSEDIEQRELMGIMRGFTSAIGVGRCSFCHTVSDGLDQPDDDFTSDDKATKVKARAMLEMVQAINSDHISQLPNRREPNVEVSCVTCHAGKRRPTTLVQELTWALDDGGAEALKVRYAELREEYYGLGAFNFGPGALDDLAQGIGRTNPDAAMEALELNLEHHPESVQTWLLKGQLLSLNGEPEAAIEAFERSLELAPGNPFATQQLERLRGGGG